ncbi:MAG: alanine--glyoxylate aminotransferase family protein [Candidatus Omnitrophica bacterium]|nr:alanine--glyoxylate aminotransferase family protein [Candidatus Omnitrophota bacterium]
MKKNKLMVAGPTEIESDVRRGGSFPMVYNRTPKFSKFILRLEKRLKMFFKTKNDVFILSSSGTGAMECALVNFLSPGDEVVILSGGTFGHRWHEIASRFKIKSCLIAVPQGKSVDPDVVEENITKKTKAVFVTANETSTGVLIDLEAIGARVKRTNAILIVDAVSSLGADRLETDKWHCDVVITASQKALAIPPGLSLITVSKKAWRLVKNSKIDKYYFDLKAYKKNLARGQTPFTPPISLLYQLDLRLKKIHKKGMRSIIEQQKDKSLYLQKRLKAVGLKIIGSKPSSGVVGILFPDKINASDIVKKLRRKYHIEITPSPGADKTRIARVGLFGDINFFDIDVLIKALKKTLCKK